MLVVLKKNKISSKETEQEVVCYLKESVVLSDRMKNTFDFVKISKKQYKEIQAEMTKNLPERRAPKREELALPFYDKDTEKIKLRQNNRIIEKEYTPEKFIK